MWREAIGVALDQQVAGTPHSSPSGGAYLTSRSRKGADVLFRSRPPARKRRARFRVHQFDKVECSRTACCQLEIESGAQPAHNPPTTAYVTTYQVRGMDGWFDHVPSHATASPVDPGRHLAPLWNTG